MTDPDSLKSAAAYLREIARSPDARRRHRKQPKIDALRQYKEEILEAHRSGVSVHRIAQIFRERNVDISVPHLVRTIRRFIEEEQRTGGKVSAARHRPASNSLEETKSKAPVTYQVPEQPSARVQEEEFAKQLRLARYLAAASLPPSRPLEPALKARAPKQERGVTKAAPKAKAEPARQKAEEGELAKERRRTGRVGRKATASGRQRSERQRGSPGR